MTDSYDCIVVGCDIAAHAAATFLAQSQVKTLLVMGRNSAPSCGDVLLPCARQALQRLKLLERAASGFVRVGESLQLLDPSGSPLLTLGGGDGSSAPIERLPQSALQPLLEEALRRAGGAVERVEQAPDIEQSASETGRVHFCTINGHQHSCRTSLFIDTRDWASQTPTWTAIWGDYRHVEPLPANSAAAAVRPLDENGWCSLTMLGSGLVRVSAVFRTRQPLAQHFAPAELFEDRLVQCPYLLQRMLAAELVGELHFVPSVPIPDPWSVFGLANDLLIGEWLAGHALENLQAGRRNSVDSPTSPETCPVRASPIAASLNALFDPAVAQPGFFASQPQLQRSLRAAIGDCQGNNSPFPSTGDKAILTRV